MRYVRVWCATAVMLCLAAGCNSLIGQNNNNNNQDGGTPVLPDLTPPAVLDVQPSALQTITVTAGQTPPTVTYQSTLNGQPASASWSIDRGDIGSLTGASATSQTFTPRGTTAGLVTLRISANGQVVKRQVVVRISFQQNGGDPQNPSQAPQFANSLADLTNGGGVGGVGGEGLGPAVTDPDTVTALQSPNSNGTAENLTLLYPYNGTVFPRGMLAPNLMWRWSQNDADAVRIDLSTASGSFAWTGTFGRPAILSQISGGKFQRHPIPQDVWDMATNSAGGLTAGGQPETLTVKITLAKGGAGYGPISQTWTIAPARLSGIIYYQSYGTLLAKNYDGAVGGDKKFGGAVLSIHVGDTAPKLTAGGSGGSDKCRICHSVAANGAQLVVQHFDTNASSSYTLTPTGATETVMSNSAEYPGVFPDGSMALSPGGQLLPLPSGSTPIPITGLSSVSTKLGTPAFSPSGTLVVFNPMEGPGITNPTQKLVVMNFDLATKAFSNPIVVVDDSGQPAERRPGWPVVFPDGNSIVFHHQSVAGFDGNALGAMATRRGARAELAWTSVTDANSVVSLNQLNGKDASGTPYLPKLLTPITMSCTGDGTQVGDIDPDHANDVSLNYEPTVNPVASGGYAWVVFTSRRLYGNLAVIPPFCSDPRGVDLVKNITPKKLWVAAVDINGKIATDASHPAFYLPAQELLAGNARGFWVLDPCKADGLSCQTGDQCCNGFCQPNGPSGSLVCSSGSSNQCSGVQERCTNQGDCCDQSNLCINNFCTIPRTG